MPNTPNKSALTRSWYSSSIVDFLTSDPCGILGELSLHAGDGHFTDQRNAWLSQIDLLQDQLKGFEGWVFFEFEIPRMGRRVDVILVIDSMIFALEFKVGRTEFDYASIDQAWDYALDLKNFHEASHDICIAPILVATDANTSPVKFEIDSDDVYKPLLTNARNLRYIIYEGLRLKKGSALDAQAWAKASYRPTPTIIEAAKALYAQHSVEAIARYDAGAQNLHMTSKRIEELIDEARSTNQKYICFITGVPGAGKTLVGLNIATQRRDEAMPTHAVFLSGNAPLVAVLREALTRDEYQRLKTQDKSVTKKKIATPVKAFIQNVHHFRDAGLIDRKPPPEHVVIFDEAQRAWNAHMTANFMKQKKGRPGFTQSEPEFLISYMDRHQDWAVIVCLVGGGQEINTGEAGISAWLDAAIKHFPNWKLFISSRLHDSEYSANNALEAAQNSAQSHHEDALHLAVSMRSFRAENVSSFVKAMLDCEAAAATRAFADLNSRFPI